MPSIDDVFAELQGINGRLNTLHNDSVTLIAGQTAVRDSVNANVAATQSVKAAVDQATAILKQVTDGQQIANVILLHLTRQAATMICSLEHIARNTCAIHTESHRQTALQTRIAGAAEGSFDIAKTAHPEAALDLDRRIAMRAALERCCPPPVEPPACEFEPCPPPKDLDIKIERDRPEKNDRKPR